LDEKEVGSSLVSIVGFELIVADGELLDSFFVFIVDGFNDGLF